MVQVNAAQISGFARYVDSKRQGGNGNGIVDGSEIEIFKKKCKTAGLDNVDDIMETYNENKTKMEAKFENDKTNSGSSVETAVISALTDKTALRTNKQATNSAESVKQGIKDADGDVKWYKPWTWFNDEEEILKSSKFINSNNAVDVLSDKETLEKIEDSDDDVKSQIVNQSVTALIKSAQAAQVDVSDIVFEEDGTYKTGRAITDVTYGSPVNENFTEVTNALTKKIGDAKKTLNGNGAVDEMLTIAAKKIDAEGNGNGYIDTEDEITAFKQFAADNGGKDIDVDTILEQIRDNEENGVENTTNAQKTIFNIFDPTQKAARDAAYAADDENVARAVGDNVENEEELNKAIGKVNSDNIMTVLNKNPELVDKIMDEYSHNWFVNIFTDDKFQNYTTPILTALVQHAKENGIDVSDIVMVDENGNMMTGAQSGVEAGKDATDEDNVQSVIKAIQDRINKEEKNA